MARSKIAGNGSAQDRNQAAARRALDDALHRLAVVRSMAEAVEGGGGNAVAGLDDSDVVGMMRLAIVDAGAAIEETLLDLGVLEDNGAPHFADRPVAAA